MALPGTSTGKRNRPQRIVIYGLEGIGKSQLASQFERPYFIATEEGVDHLDVASIEPKTAAEVETAIRNLITLPHDYKTAVIDTADWWEKFHNEAVCQKHEKEGMADFGFNKGVEYVAEEMMKGLALLNELRAKRNMHIVLLAHSTVTKFKDPLSQEPYDRYELKLSKAVSKLVKEWCDHLLFYNYKTLFAKDKQNKMQVLGGKERQLETEHCARFDAKNRWGLPPTVAVPKAGLPPDIERALAGGVAMAASPIGVIQNCDPVEIMELVTKQGVTMPQALAFMRYRKVIDEAGDFASAGVVYLLRIKSDPKVFADAVRAHATLFPVAEEVAA